MPLQSIEPRRLYRQIADQLRALIEQGEFPAGSRLPPERDLAAQLGVSRPSVREALIALEVEGRVEVRMGSGIYVRAADPAASRSVPHEVESPLETLRARALIEGELAAQAARRMRRPQLAGLRESIERMEQAAAAGRVPSEADRLFHLRIAEASGNAVLTRVVGELYDERHNPLFEQLGSHFETTRSWVAAIAEHRAVLEAIAQQSPDAAREAMVRHLTASHDRFLVGWNGAAKRAAVPRRPAARRAPPRATRRG